MSDEIPRTAEKKCIACKTDIPRDANLCANCDTYQDARRFIPISQTTLALLVALVSSLTTVTAVLLSSLESKQADLRLEVLHSDVYSLLQAVALNAGNTSGLIEPEGILRLRFNDVNQQRKGQTLDARVFLGTQLGNEGLILEAHERRILSLSIDGTNGTVSDTAPNPFESCSLVYSVRNGDSGASQKESKFDCPTKWPEPQNWYERLKR